MDKLDIKIINRLQYGFPICEYPYAEVAKEVDISESELIGRITNMLHDRTLTRFGPMYHAEVLGGGLSLAAMAIPKESYKQVADIVNDMPEIAHNYERTHELNMWFVIATEYPEELNEVIARIEEKTGFHVYNMPKLEEYYVGFYLDL
jgi:DNA-binding Lrp family transcriptional regulator